MSYRPRSAFMTNCMLISGTYRLETVFNPQSFKVSLKGVNWFVGFPGVWLCVCFSFLSLTFCMYSLQLSWPDACLRGSVSLCSHACVGTCNVNSFLTKMLIAQFSFFFFFFTVTAFIQQFVLSDSNCSKVDRASRISFVRQIHFFCCCSARKYHQWAGTWAWLCVTFAVVQLWGCTQWCFELNM